MFKPENYKQPKQFNGPQEIRPASFKAIDNSMN